MNDKWLSFRGHNKKERLLFAVYADLECILAKKTTDENMSRFSYQHHKAFSLVLRVGYYVRCVYDETMSIYKSYRGEDCVSWFVKELYDLAHRAKTIFDKNMAMAEFTSNIECEQFRNATHCHICERPFEEGDLRVHDHCHLTGRYRGPAHSRCNLQYNDTYVIPIFFHNLTGYDAHFIIKDIANSFVGRVNLLPITKEKYISFTKHVKDTANSKWGMDCLKLRFVDSFKFLNTSLEKLVSYLDKNKSKIIRSEFSNLHAEDFDLLTRKGVFPYEYIDSVDKLNETSLPPRELFYSSLTDETASDDDYQHATNVWRRFCVETLGDYSDLYLKTDVLLLADVFENFRDTCIESYGLDPAYYYTLPGYTLDAMLKYTGIRFELLTDIDMVMFVERGVRGGLSQCSHRYAQANNKYNASSYDPSEPSTYLMYFDMNNLYGWAMSESFPYGEFQWVDDIERFDVMSVSSDSVIGYILEVDLAYPQSVHDAHVDLPFCPIRERPPGKRNVKLLATLYDKERYVVYYRNLQQYIYHGLRITKIYHTDSLIYLLECENVYEDIKRDIARYDTNDYPERNAYDIPRVNNKIPGLMKDENCGAIMTEFIGLRAKMYALRVIGKSDTKRIKGERVKSRRQSCIRSTFHEVYTVSELKLALNPYDDKRYVVPESVTTLPWGHYKIPL
ncbi:PREDICTED: uncharacterized protein LOC108770891 [Trachymyrmex cornetzi]|uniref:uncharacterized protein LOC108770891 n=1 Tax=Trachymyrmex cornetzi TaxID=471704 RepID=UPI00084F266B|nr:PREDICTED: uncharacterized protein LOC108770891 [Trachymyrmex cornetzi]